MKTTLISYCDSTINPTKYCVGCELWTNKVRKCYAGRMTERWQGPGAFNRPVELVPGKIAQAASWSDLRGLGRADKPWLNNMPRVIFIGDMSDILSPSVPFEYLHDEIIQNVSSPLGQRHIYLLLTKQAPRLAQFDQWLSEQGIAWPINLWPGVSITSQSTVRRVAPLLKVRARTRWLSLEPLLEPVDLTDHSTGWKLASGGIHWVACGGESGPQAETMNEYLAHIIRDQCKAAGVRFYMKQMGGKHDKLGKLEDIPVGLRIREMPE